MPVSKYAENYFSQILNTQNIQYIYYLWGTYRDVLKSLQGFFDSFPRDMAALALSSITCLTI